MPELPFTLGYLWSAFLELMDPVGNGFGPVLISFQDIVSYGQAFGTPFRGWEVNAIRGLSVVYLNVANEKGRNVPSNMTNATKMNDVTGLKALFMKQGVKTPNVKKG